jgi:glutathione peroxidase
MPGETRTRLLERSAALRCRTGDNRGVSLYDIEVKTIDGTVTPLSIYRGKTLLIVNVASRCGYTPQYEGLEQIYRDFKDQGLVVLGFPCNQFGGQEPGTEDEIAAFCETTYGVTFPLFAKLDVNGSNAHPLFQQLKQAQKGLLGTASIKWNFTKFLVDATGTVRRRYGPADTPAEIRRDLAAMLG